MKDYQGQIWQTMIFCFNEIAFSGYPHCFCQLVASDQKGTPLLNLGGGKHTNNKHVGERWLRRELTGTSYMLLPLSSSGKYLPYSVLRGKVSTQDAKLRDWLLLVPRCNRAIAHSLPKGLMQFHCDNASLKIYVSVLSYNPCGFYK